MVTGYFRHFWAKSSLFILSTTCVSELEKSVYGCISGESWIEFNVLSPNSYIKITWNTSTLKYLKYRKREN